jgi:hypothetical protein
MAGFNNTGNIQRVNYRIRVKGQIDPKWADWFDGFSISRLDNDETLLTGSVPDQPALHGLLNKIRDLGLPLISLIKQD